MAPDTGVPPGRDQIIISPDGALNLIPFAALLERTQISRRNTISYVTSGRDLDRLEGIGPTLPRRGPPMIVANPSFARPRGGGRAGPEQQVKRSRDSRLRFDPLPGTAQEAAALAKVLPDARVYTGADATESAV